jgi:hypothetical protein
MRSELTAVRILPMSSKLEGFEDLSILDVQERYFLDRLPKGGGQFQYQSSGLHAGTGTVVLFQFRARIIASAVFIRDERYEEPVGGHAGALWFKPESFRTFDPVDVAGMQKAWRLFRGFGHVKQALSPGQYPEFKKGLRKVRMPGN